MLPELWPFPEQELIALELLEENVPDHIEGLEDFGVAEPIVDGVAFLAAHKDTAIFHHGEVLGEGGQADPQATRQFPDAQLLLTQRVDDLQAGRMGEDLTHFGMVGVEGLL
jgi:hypothetical protein